MTAFTVGIALDHDGLGIVEQDFLRHSAEELARLFNTTQPVILAFLLGEPDIGGTTKPQRSNEGFNLAPVTRNGREIDLHLLARRRLKAYHRIKLDSFELSAM